MPSTRPSNRRAEDHIARLTIQARAWAPAAAALLDHIGVARGWIAVDLGSGPLGILDLLSDRVGREGRVVGVERDPAALLAAMAATGGRRNVRLAPGDVTRTGLARGGFDLVHARLVCQESGTEPLLREMVSLVRPGGVVVLEEPGVEPWSISPPPPEYERLATRVSRALLRRRSGIGPALPARLRRLGLVRISARPVTLTLRGGSPYAAMPLFALARARSTLLASGAATARTLRRLETALHRAARDPGVLHTTFPLWQVSGYRRGGRPRPGA